MLGSISHVKDWKIKTALWTLKHKVLIRSLTATYVWARDPGCSNLTEVKAHVPTTSVGQDSDPISENLLHGISSGDMSYSCLTITEFDILPGLMHLCRWAHESDSTIWVSSFSDDWVPVSLFIIEHCGSKAVLISCMEKPPHCPFNVRLTMP